MNKIYFGLVLFFGLFISAFGQNPTSVIGVNGITNQNGNTTGSVLLGLSTNGAGAGYVLTYSGTTPVWSPGSAGTATNVVNNWTALQRFNGDASASNLTVSGTSTFNS